MVSSSRRFSLPFFLSELVSVAAHRESFCRNSEIRSSMLTCVDRVPKELH